MKNAHDSQTHGIDEVADQVAQHDGDFVLSVSRAVSILNMKKNKMEKIINHYVSRATTYLTSKKKLVSEHMKNLGVAGYTGSYVYLITNRFNGVFIALLISGVLFTLLANKLSKYKRIK